MYHTGKDMENKVEILRNTEAHSRSFNIKIHEIPKKIFWEKKRKSSIKYSRKPFTFQIKGVKSMPAK